MAFFCPCFDILDVNTGIKGCLRLGLIKNVNQPIITDSFRMIKKERKNELICFFGTPSALYKFFSVAKKKK